MRYDQLINKLLSALWHNFINHDAEYLKSLFDTNITESQINQYNERRAMCSKSTLERSEEIVVKNEIWYGFPIDHFAIIDLSGINSGRHILKDIFATLGLVVAGEEYLEEKQNPFLWMRSADHAETKIDQCLPQIVLADFKLDAFPPHPKAILEKYANQAVAFDLPQLKLYLEQGDDIALEQALNLILSYLLERPWPLPTKEELLVVMEFNQLAAWVLAFGRKINHFGIAIHLLTQFSSLESFNQQIANTNLVELNTTPKLIKGGEECGIAQSSTMGQYVHLQLKDGDIKMRGSFTEFVWRYNNIAAPLLAKDYYMDFIPANANGVIQSLYHKNRCQSD